MNFHTHLHGTYWAYERMLQVQQNCDCSVKLLLKTFCTRSGLAPTSNLKTPTFPTLKLFSPLLIQETWGRFQYARQTILRTSSHAISRMVRHPVGRSVMFFLTVPDNKQTDWLIWQTDWNWGETLINTCRAHRHLSKQTLRFSQGLSRPQKKFFKVLTMLNPFLKNLFIVALWN